MPQLPPNQQSRREQKLKEITYDKLKKECEPTYIIKYSKLGDVIIKEAKFHSPIKTVNFVKQLPADYHWTIYKKQ